MAGLEAPLDGVMESTRSFNALSLIICREGSFKFMCHIHTSLPEESETQAPQHTVTCSQCPLKCLSHAQMFDQLMNFELEGQKEKGHHDIHSISNDIDRDACQACRSCGFMTYSTECLDKHTLEEHPGQQPGSVSKAVVKKVSAKIRLLDVLFYSSLLHNVNNVMSQPNIEFGAEAEVYKPSDKTSSLGGVWRQETKGNAKDNLSEGIEEAEAGKEEVESEMLVINSDEQGNTVSSTQGQTLESQARHQTRKNMQRQRASRGKKAGHHLRRKAFACPKCCRRFPGRADFHQHMRDHRQREMFKCRRCGMAFTLRHDLELHLEAHYGENEKHNNNNRIEDDNNMSLHGGPGVLTQQGINEDTSSSFSSSSSPVKLEVAASYRPRRNPPRQSAKRKRGRPAKKAGQPASSRSQPSRQKRSSTASTSSKKSKKKSTITNANRGKSEGEDGGHTDDDDDDVMGGKDDVPAMFECPKCQCIFQDAAFYLAHLKTHREAVPDQENAEHQRFVGINPHRCSLCGKSYATLRSLQRHMTQHPGEKLFRCAECGRGFGDKGRYKAHLQREHTADGQQVAMFECPKCHAIFQDPACYLAHLKSHRAPLAHDAQHHQGAAPMIADDGDDGCLDDDNNYVDHAGFEQRQRGSKAGDTPHRCGVCGKSYALMRSLQRHTMTLHPGVKLFKCAQCGKGFSQNSNYRLHMRRAHGVRNYECNECGKRFFWKESLDIHTRQHTGKDLIVCQVCGKNFTRKIDFERHMRTHTGERPFRCDVCGKGFCVKSAHKKHMRIHTGERPYQCEECGKTFRLIGAFQDHMRRHWGDKRFKCDVCGKPFVDRHSKARHEKRHYQQNSRYFRKPPAPSTATTPMSLLPPPPSLQSLPHPLSQPHHHQHHQQQHHHQEQHHHHHQDVANVDGAMLPPPHASMVMPPQVSWEYGHYMPAL